MQKTIILKSERLTLSIPKVADIPSIVEYAGHEKVAATTQNMPHPYAQKDAVFWINMAEEGLKTQTHYIFGIRINSTSEFVGGIGITINQAFDRGELGYWIGVPFWNKGYTTEATKLILQFGFEQLKLNKIYAVHLVGNLSSGKVMLKNGMIKEGELKEHYKKGDEYRSVIQYRLTKGEYNKLTSTSFSIETTNLRLRIPSEADIPYIFSATRYKGFNDGMAWEAPKSATELFAPLQRNLEKWKVGNSIAFTIEQKDTRDFLGRISIRKTKEKNVWNIGFFTHPKHQGKGIMTEAVKEILHFGFTTLKAIRIEAEYAHWNKASEKVLHNNGFQFIRFIEKGLLKNGEWVAENAVAIEYKDWKVLTYT